MKIVRMYGSWCLIDEETHEVIESFDTREEALQEAGDIERRIAELMHQWAVESTQRIGGRRLA